MSQPLVSVVIPCYQAEKYVQRCINSIINQSYDNLQIITVNDGSTDNTEKMLEHFRENDPRMQVITIKNGGVANARNIALQHIKGEFVLFVDCDDWLMKNSVKILKEAIDFANADAAQGSMVHCYENGNTLKLEPIFKSMAVFEKEQFKSTIFMKMITGIQLNHVHHMLYKTTILQGITMDKTLKTAEDLLFNMQVFTKAQRYVYTQEPVYNYFIRADSLTGSSLGIAEKFKCNIKISQQMLKLLPQWGMDNFDIKLRVLARPVMLIFSKMFRILQNKKNSEAI